VPDPTGIYIHVPFCSAICNYCNFNRGLHDEDLHHRYVDAVVAHVAREGDGTPVDTIYFGGGTPSLLHPDEVARIVEQCAASFALDRDHEITLEANPESVDPARLRGWRAAGVNRISLGVQSFRDEELRRLGRLHSVARALAAIAEARAAGFDNLSLDLMMWLPAQTIAQWQESVEALIAAGPEHASLYLLEVYPNAPLKDAMARSGWSQSPEDDAAQMYEWAMERLAAAGYEAYEISNVARPHRRARHNVKYWTDGTWLAFGPGAHGARDGYRWKNLSATADYVAGIRDARDVRVEVQRLSPGERAAEALFMGLRLREGVDVAQVRDRYGVDARARYGGALAWHVKAGLIELGDARWALTPRGRLLANDVMAVFV
jgi:oxygen-independent coproporphyrinogen-3 oxidase